MGLVGSNISIFTVLRSEYGVVQVLFISFNLAFNSSLGLTV